MAYINLLQIIYPIGSYYISASATSPASIMGGTWSQISGGRFLCAAGNDYQAGSTGGSASVALSVDQLPAHWHEVQENSSSDGTWKQLGMWFTNVGAGTGWAIPVGGGYTVPSPRVATDTIGENLSHENRPPYIVAYIWRRTA